MTLVRLALTLASERCNIFQSKMTWFCGNVLSSQEKNNLMEISYFTDCKRKTSTLTICMLYKYYISF